MFDMLSQKIDNLSLPIDSIDVITGCKKAWAKISEVQRCNNVLIDKANKIKNDSRLERLSLRRSLCKAKSLALHDELSAPFKKLREKTSTAERLAEAIRKKEQKSRISKREKVYETLDFALNQFFNGKYQVDKASFQIKFLGNTVGDNASSILSNTMNYFFIIDDPISSMDVFQHHYKKQDISSRIYDETGINKKVQP